MPQRLGSLTFGIIVVVHQGRLVNSAGTIGVNDCVSLFICDMIARGGARGQLLEGCGHSDGEGGKKKKKSPAISQKFALNATTYQPSAPPLRKWEEGKEAGGHHGDGIGENRRVLEHHNHNYSMRLPCERSHVSSMPPFSPSPTHTHTHMFGHIAQSCLIHVRPEGRCGAEGVRLHI